MNGVHSRERRPAPAPSTVEAMVAPDRSRPAAHDLVRSVLSSPGRPLDADARTYMEPRFGHDFSKIRIHSDAQADRSAKAVDANAYTVGAHVVFREGAYAPASETGRRTLAHELAHVIQQAAGPVEGARLGGGLSVSHPGDRFERAAETTAAEALSTTRHNFAAIGVRDADSGLPRPAAGESSRRDFSESVPPALGGGLSRHHLGEIAIQRKRIIPLDSKPTLGYQVYIDKDLKGKTYQEYADAEYETNRSRAERIRGLLAKKLLPKQEIKQEGAASKQEIKKEGSPDQHPYPNVTEWDVVPDPGALDKVQIRPYGLKITYIHRTLKYGAQQKVSYESQIKRDQNGLHLQAAANYAPNPEQRRGSADPFINMNLNGIWAAQLAYYQLIESRVQAEKPKLGGNLLASVKRSKIENPSTLATYWVTNQFGSDHVVADLADWMALAGSPNGNALLYLVLDNPELIATPNPDIATNLSLLFKIAVTHDGPYMIQTLTPMPDIK